MTMNFILCGLGAVVGACLRSYLSDSFNTKSATLPWGTILANQYAPSRRILWWAYYIFHLYFGILKNGIEEREEFGFDLLRGECCYLSD